MKKEPITIIDGKLFLKRHNIALFDVIKECNIKGSSDSSIKNVIVNNFSNIFKESKIKKIFTTGNKATELYRKYINNDNISLPSPSAANAKMNLNELVNSYSIILPFLV